MRRLLSILLTALGIRPVAHAKPLAQMGKREGLYPERLFGATVNRSEICVQWPDGRLESVPIAHLREVAIVTNDSGPTGVDVWWMLTGM